MLGSNEIGTRGIVINRTSSGEGSVRVGIFTEALGLVSAIARSAREERSKLRPHLTVGTFGFFDLVHGTAGWRVVGAVDTQNSYFAFHEYAEAQKAAARLLSLLRQLIQGEEKDEALFDAVWHFLTALEHIPPEELSAAERLAVLHSLAALGYVSQSALPQTAGADYSSEALGALASNEKEILRAIKNGFVASGLV